MPAYEVFAPFYDLVMDDPAPRAARVADWIDRFHPGATSLLELGCGTGSLLVRLDPALDRWGLDASPAMLDRAMAKAPGTHLVAGDMADFDLGRTFDVVACIFDSLNHLLTVDAWRTCLASVHDHLGPGGLFVLDVNTVGELCRLGEEPPEVYDFDGGVAVVDVEAAVAAGGLVETVWDVRIFERVDGDAFRLHHERIVELAVPLDVLGGLLDRIGFDILEMVGADGGPATDASVKAHVACRRR